MEYAKRTARISRSTLFWVLAALLGSAAVNLPTAHGQAITRVGDRVRITAPDMGLTEAVGTLREVDGQNLLVEFNRNTGCRTAQRPSRRPRFLAAKPPARTPQH